MRLKFWAGMIVSAGLLVFLFSRIDYARLWAVIKSADPFYLAAAAVINIAFLFIRAVRWRYLLEPVKKGISLSSLFSATMIGFMANNVLPARLGEFVRAYALGRREEVPKSSVFATIVVERLFDTMSVLLLLIIVLVFMPASVSEGEIARNMQRAGMVSLAVYVVSLVLLGYFIYRPGIFLRALAVLLKPFPAWVAEKAAGVAEKFLLGLAVVKDPRLLLLILFYSALHWGPLFLVVYLLFKAFGLAYGVYASLFFLVVSCFSVAVPSTPGYVGTYEAAGMGAMMFLGMGKEPALGFAILSHAVAFIPVTLLGLFYLYRENLSLAGLKEVEEGAE